MSNQYSFRRCPLLSGHHSLPLLHPLPAASLAPRYRSRAQRQHGHQIKVTPWPRLSRDDKATAKPRRPFSLGITSSLPTKRTSPRSKAVTDPRSFDYQFCLCDAKGKRLAAGGAGRFQHLIQLSLVKRWTGIVSPGRARDVQINFSRLASSSCCWLPYQAKR